MVLLRILILYWQEEFLPFLYVSAEKTRGNWGSDGDEEIETTNYI